MNLLNVLFLMCICFLPFPTDVLARFLDDPYNRETAATFYAIGLVLPAAIWTLAWIYASHSYRLIDRHLASEFVHKLSAQYLTSVALYAVAVLLSLISFKAGLGICVDLTLLYLLPPRNPVYVSSGSGGDVGRAGATHSGA